MYGRLAQEDDKLHIRPASSRRRDTAGLYVCNVQEYGERGLLKYPMARLLHSYWSVQNEIDGCRRGTTISNVVFHACARIHLQFSRL